MSLEGGLQVSRHRPFGVIFPPNHPVLRNVSDAPSHTGGRRVNVGGVAAALQFKVLPPAQWLSVLFPAVTGLRENQTNYLSNYQTNYLSNYQASLFTGS